MNVRPEPAGITWIEEDDGWVAAPEDVVAALAREGFRECKRETTTSRRDGQPTGGVWQGVDPRSGSVAAAVWVTGPAWPRALMFVQVDGQPVAGGRGAAPRAVAPPAGERDPYRDEGGEG